MMTDIDKEVDSFLQSVEALTEADLLPVPSPVIADPTEEVDNNKECIDAINNASLTAGGKKTGGNRHRWRHQNVVGEYYDQTTKEKKYCNVFLDDKNTQDLLFSELLIVVGLLRMSYIYGTW